MKKTKKCKFCQTDIPNKAKVCPNCKRTLSGGHGCLASFLVFAIIIAGGSITAINMNDFTQKTVSGVKDDDEYITMEEYNKIETGMSYKQVKKIVGSSGEISSQVESNGYKIIMVTWYGNGLAGSNANVTFTNDEVTAKAQVGLK